MNIFAERLKQAREQSGLSARELAKRAHTSHPTVLRAEHGSNLSLKQWLKLMDATGVKYSVKVEIL